MISTWEVSQGLLFHYSEKASLMRSHLHRELSKERGELCRQTKTLRQEHAERIAKKPMQMEQSECGGVIAHLLRGK